MRGEQRYIVHVRLLDADGEEHHVPLTMAKSHAAIFPRYIRVRRDSDQTRAEGQVDDAAAPVGSG